MNVNLMKKNATRIKDMIYSTIQVSIKCVYKEKQ